MCAGESFGNRSFFTWMAGEPKKKSTLARRSSRFTPYCNHDSLVMCRLASIHAWTIARNIAFHYSHSHHLSGSGSQGNTYLNGPFLRGLSNRRIEKERHLWHNRERGRKKLICDSHVLHGPGRAQEFSPCKSRSRENGELQFNALWHGKVDQVTEDTDRGASSCWIP